MTARALFVAGTDILPAANDVPPHSPYRASARDLAPGEATLAMREDRAQVLLFVERGSIELMVGGAAFTLTATQTARITAGTVFAYRNTGSTGARVSTAIVPPETRSTCPITVAA